MWGEEQHGFRKDRGCADGIFITRRIIEEFGLTTSSTGAGDNLYLLFVDLKKAFDSCDRGLIFQLLHKCGVPSNIINIIRAFHDGFGARVMLNGSIGPRFDMTTGVRQGCCAAPTLWNFYFFFISRLWRERCRNIDG